MLSRHGVCYKKACGESNEVSEEDCQKWKAEILPSLLEKYNESDIFNADESGLFYKCLPDKTLTFRNEKCHGGKYGKERVTIMLAANMNGTEKIKILVIGKSKKPRCFRGVKSLPVDYKSNKRAWMTGQIFEEWMVKLDKKFTAAGRKVIFFVDNCPAHPKDIQSKLKSIELAFFPPNMTSKLQPLDQGIIRCLKAHYRNRVLKEAIFRIEKNCKCDINVLECINHLSRAWDIDVTSQTISNCFTKSGFGQHSVWDKEDDIPLVLLSDFNDNANVLKDNYEIWLRLNDVESTTCTVQEFVDIDNELITSEFPTDEDIIEECTVESESHFGEIFDSDENEVEETVRQPSRLVIKDSFKNLNAFLNTNEKATDDHYKALHKLESLFAQSKSEQTQSKITQYFSV